jgi:hypothetical protein
MQTITVDAVFEKVTSIYDSLKAGDANAGRENGIVSFDMLQGK